LAEYNFKLINFEPIIIKMAQKKAAKSGGTTEAVENDEIKVGEILKDKKTEPEKLNAKKGGNEEKDEKERILIIKKFTKDVLKKYGSIV